MTELDLTQNVNEQFGFTKFKEVYVDIHIVP